MSERDTENSIQPANLPRVKMGISGLDDIIGKGQPSEGLRPGSLIVIVGPPGSGKTLLALQLLQAMYWSDRHPDARPGLFISADESEDVIKTQIATILPPVVHVRPPVVVEFGHKLIRNAYDIAAEVSKRLGPENPYMAEQLFGEELVLRNARRRARAELVEAITSSWIKPPQGVVVKNANDKYSCLCVDGIMNLPEVRCEDENERRDALFTVAACLRSLIRSADPSEPPYKAAILTTEYWGDRQGQSQLEDYLADVVIRLSTEPGVGGKRRRRMEILKCRYARVSLGTHSLLIWDQNEVQERRNSHELLGWMPHTLDMVRRGITIFPRVHRSMRFWANHQDVELETAVIDARDAVAAVKDPSYELKHAVGEGHLDRIMAKLLRQQWLAPADMETVEKISNSAIEAQIKYMNGGPIEKAAKAIDCLCELLRERYAQQAQLDGTADEPYCSFGISGLDHMFGQEGIGGVARCSSTAIVGGPGTGKSSLAYSFMLKGITSGDDVVFMSFDERLRRVLQQSGNLRVEKGANAGKLEYSIDLSEMVAQQFRLRTASPDALPRLRFVYQNPATCDSNEWMHLLRCDICSFPGVGETGKFRRTRLIIDSITDLERNIDNPREFNHLVTTLLNSCADWRVTPLMLYEAPDGQNEGDRLLSHLADNVILLRQVHVNNQSRKCVLIRKARGRRHELAPAELSFQSIPQYEDGVCVEVRKGFEGMSRILSGSPEPANVTLRLFEENGIERKWNRRLLKDLQSRYGAQRFQLLPFNLDNARMAYWDREKARDIRPDTDVTIVALDEPWVQIFAQMGANEGPALAPWDPSAADSLQRALVGNLFPKIRDQAARAEVVVTGSMRPLVAIPYNVDLGLLLYRPDLLKNNPLPDYWIEDVPGNMASRSFISTARQLRADGYQGPVFAFNMDNVETTVCVFLELCWSFFARQRFLLDPDEQDRKAAIDALLFLAQLRWEKLLPFPCTLQHCADSVFSRIWYANLPALKPREKGNRWRQIPYLTACKASDAIRSRLCAEIEEAGNDLNAIQQQLRTLSLPNAYPEYLAHTELLDCMADRLAFVEERRHELQQNITPLRGLTCSGGWYLGVISSGGNANLGWSIVQEAVDRRRMSERAEEGVGLPAYRGYYRDHGNDMVPFIDNMNFEQLRGLLRRTRCRSSAWGLRQNQPIKNRDILQNYGLLPDILNGLVKHILEEPESNPANENRARKFVEDQVDRVFRDISSRLGDSRS